MIRMRLALLCALSLGRPYAIAVAQDPGVEPPPAMVTDTVLGVPEVPTETPLSALLGETATSQPTSLLAAEPAATPAAQAPLIAPEATANGGPTPSVEKDEDRPEQPKAQDPAVRADLEQRLKALDGASLKEEEKQRAAAFYRQALDAFDQAEQQIEAAAKFQEQIDRIKTGKQSTQEYARKLASPLLPYEDVSGEPLHDVEARAARVETSLAEYKQQLQEMIDAPKLRSQRMTELPQQLDDLQQKLSQGAAELAALGSEDSADTLVAARRAALTQSDYAFRAALYALSCERQLYEQNGEWVKLRRDYYSRYVPYKEKRLVFLKQEINRRREDEARRQAQEAALAVRQVQGAVGTPQAIVSDLAGQNKDLAEERALYTSKITILDKQMNAAQEELDALNDLFTRAKKQEEVEELSHLSGQLLRDQRNKLPNLRSLRRSTEQCESELSAALLRSYDLDDQRSELANIDDLADQLAARAGDLSDAVRTQIRELLGAKREILEKSHETCEKYSRKLAELHSKQSQLIATTEECSAFIAERVLWIRSCDAISVRDLEHAFGGIAWSLDPGNWRDAGAAMFRAAEKRSWACALTLLALVALAASQRLVRRVLRDQGAEAEKRGCTRLRPTFNAAGLTVILALPFPLAFALAGWLLDSLSESEFARALGVSCRFAAICLLLLELTRHLCRRRGLADAHFDWPDVCLAQVRRKLRWFVAFAMPLVLWLVGLEVQTVNPAWSASLGRLCFIAVMLMMALMFQRLLLAANSPFRHAKLINGRGWLTPVQIAWRPAVALLPVALAVLAAVGYYFTAQQAAWRVLESAATLLAVATLGGVTRRWLLVNRRQLAREQAKQRRAQLAAAAEADPSTPAATDGADELVDLAALSEQTQKLVRTALAITTAVGLWIIWGELLPALAYPAEKLVPGADTLTWGQVAKFLIALAVTYISVRDVPALLELVVLQHLPLDGGARYACSTLCRYVIAGVGVSAAFNAIGARWGDIQWLVAAMSVGLGFGLQEIFANFVSGVILLFERPIRVGDIVTLGDKSGVVSRIRMRATTIVDWDRKEYIVPNKDLVTERLLNWTLSDNMNRVTVSVGIAHGNDTERACELLLECARQQQHILNDPPPVAYFKGFTDNSLLLELNCYLPNLDNRTATIHQLNTAIDRRFRAAGLEIPYPQRDMRVKLDGEVIELLGGSSKPTIRAKAAG